MSKSRLVHLVDDVPELDDVDELVMLQVLDGFLDAGNVAARAVRQLVASSPTAPVIATFDVDAFHDYRARRPAISFVQDHYESYDAPRLVVRLLRDAGGTPYLLLSGPEPDNRWEAYARAVREVVEHFEVTEVLSLGSVPMAVPHSRPLAITHHANNPALLHETSPWRGEIRVPSSAQALVELRLGEWRHDAHGFVAHIPHYLAQLDYPSAAVALLERVERAARLTIDFDDLRHEAASHQEEIATYLREHEEVREVVAALERQYDAFTRSEESGSNLLAPDQPLPTGEELGREFEQFLAGLGENAADDDVRPGDEGDPRDGGEQ